jgi:hypothetical protein
MLNDAIAMAGVNLPTTERSTGNTGLTIRQSTGSVTINSITHKVVRRLSIGQQDTREGLRTLIRLDETYTPLTGDGSPFKEAAQLVLVSNSILPQSISEADLFEKVGQVSALNRLLAIIAGNFPVDGSEYETSYNEIQACNIGVGLLRVINGED